jgi:hypothetical protein
MDFGSACIIALGGITLWIRGRHMTRYGGWALLVLALWTVGLGIIRLCNGLEVIQRGGLINSWWSIGWACIQLEMLFHAEVTMRRRTKKLLRLAALADERMAL